jgi:uncharacterized damage-inducible protein DinB
MMAHPLVDQLRFTRSEFKRGLEGLADAEARRRFLPMNCISYNIGHMAAQEQRYWLKRAQGRLLIPQVDEAYSYGAPPSTPPLNAALEAWGLIIEAVDPWLDALTTEKLLQHVILDGKPSTYIFGSLLQRVIYHYWYHTGENMAIRQMFGHTGLPEFVGDIDAEAPYRPEPH